MKLKKYEFLLIVVTVVFMVETGIPLAYGSGLEVKKAGPTTTVRVSGPNEVKEGESGVFHIEFSAEAGNPLAPINLIGPGTVALALPESVDVDYENIRMQMLAYGSKEWEEVDWQAKEGLISQGIVTVIRELLTVGLSKILATAGHVVEGSEEVLDVLQEHYAPVEQPFQDLNHYDIVRVEWDWSLYRWKIGSYRGRGQGQVNVTIPIRFTEDFVGELPLALFLAYENRPRNERGTDKHTTQSGTLFSSERLKLQVRRPGRQYGLLTMTAEASPDWIIIASSACLA